MRNKIKFSASFFIIILSIMFGFVANAEENVINNSIETKCQNFPGPDFCQNEKGKVGAVIDINKENGCYVWGCVSESDAEQIKKKLENRIISGEFGEFSNKLKNPINNSQVNRTNIETKIQDKIRDNKSENKLQKKSKEGELEAFKEGIKEAQKNKLETLIQSVKEKRELFKTQLEANKEANKTKIENAKNNFQLGLTKIKSESKKNSTENIVNTIQKLNIKMTDIFTDKINKLENVLVSIDSRITKAEDKGIDTTSVKSDILKAKESIDQSRAIIAEQAKKVYEVNITSEANLKTDMKTLRDTFVKDIKVVRDSIKTSEKMVHDIAKALAKVPKIDSEDKIETEDTTPVVVEDDINTATNN